MTRNSIPAVAVPALAPLALADDMPVIQAHWQGMLPIGMAPGAVALTVVNVLQLGLDPLTDAGAGGATSAGLADADGAGTSEAAAEDPTGEEGPSSCANSPAIGGSSFTAGTLVLLASGKAVPLSALKADLRSKMKQFGTLVFETSLREMVAIDIPRDANHKAVRDYLSAGEDRELWEFEEGAVSRAHDEGA